MLSSLVMRGVVISLALFSVLSVDAQTSSALVSVIPTGETDPVPHSGDAADDSCVWVHPTEPERSVVVGTDKQGGLAVYHLGGTQIHYYADGRMNNVDIRHGLSLGGSKVDIVAASNRSTNVLAIYRVNPITRGLEEISARPLGVGLAIYGMCLYHSEQTGKFYAIANSEEGVVKQYGLSDDGDGKVLGTMVRQFDVGEQTEGCVADDELGALYIGEEEVGLWRYSAEPNVGDDRVRIDAPTPAGHFTPDIEGLTIYYGEGTTGYLIASSQGDSMYTVYRREGNNDFVCRFSIGAGANIDAVSGTDGIDVTSCSLGRAFPNGVFVAQDDSNDGQNQNFKLVPWESIASAMSPGLQTYSGRNPRD